MAVRTDWIAAPTDWIGATKKGLLITWPVPILPFALSLSKGERMWH